MSERLINSRIVTQRILRTALALSGAGLLVVAMVFGLLKPENARAATGINKTINFQGRLLTSTGAVVADGNYNMEFKLYQDGPGNVAGDTGGTLKWTEDYQNNTSSEGVAVKNGYFSVNLGTYCAFDGSACTGGQTQSNSAVNWDQSVLWLSMNVGGTTTGAPSYDGELLPMKRLASAVYALQAANSDALGGIGASGFIQNIAPGATQQTANINILSGAATNVAAAEIQAVASATAPVLILKGNTSSTGDLLQLQNASSTVARITAGGDFYVNGTIDTQSSGSLSLGTGNATAVTIGNTTSATAITINAGTGNAGGDINIGNDQVGSQKINIGNTSGTATQTINIGADGTSGASETITLGASTGAGTTTIQSGSGLLKLQSNSGSINLITKLSTTGVLVQSNTNNSATAFQVQNAATGQVLTVDTSGNQLVLGQASTLNGKILFNNGSNATTATVYDDGNLHVDGGSNNVWVDGSNLYLNANSHGNVGINTSSPGDILTVNGNIQVRDADSATKAFRLRTSGSAVDLESGGSQLYLSTWSGGNFAGTQYNQFIFDNAGADIAAQRSMFFASGADRSLYVQSAASGNNGNNLTIQAGSGNGTNMNGGNLVLQGGNSTGVGTPGSVIAKPQTNTATAFQVQKSSGVSVLNVDTTSGNLITNPSIEATIGSEWAASGTGVTASRITTQSYLGSASLQVATNGAANDGVKQTLATTLAASTQYMISWYDKLNSGTFTDVQASFSYDGTTGNASACTGQNTGTVNTLGWTRHYCKFTTGSAGTAPTASNAIFIQQTAGATRTFYIDAVQLEATTNATPSAYTDGAVQLNGAVTQQLVVQPTNRSTTALQVLDSAGSNIFQVDTLDQSVGIGTSSLLSAAKLNVSVPSGSMIGLRINQVGTGDIMDLLSNNVAVESVLQNGTVVFGHASASNPLAGVLQLADGSSANAGTIQLGGSLGAPATYNLPTTTGTQTICTSATSSCSTAGSGYIQNQSSSPGTQQTGNFNISGTGLLATLDSTGTGLNIGTTNASTITIGKSSANTATTINGTALVKPTSGNDSATAFQVQNAAGAAILAVDSTVNQLVTTANLNVGSPANIGTSGAAGHGFSDGFESGSILAWSNTAGSATPTLDTTTVHSGKYSYKIATSGTNRYLEEQSLNGGNGYTTIFGREYFNASTVGNPTYLMDFGTAPMVSGTHMQITLGTSGDICWTAFTGITAGCTSTAPSTNVWHKLEAELVISNGSGQLQIWLDNTNIQNQTALSTGTTAITNFALGKNSATTATVNYDDVAVDGAATGDGASAYVANDLHVSGDTTLSGQVLLQPAADSGLALQIFSSGGLNRILTVDSSNNHVYIGASGSCPSVANQGRFCVGQSVTSNGGTVVNSLTYLTVNNGSGAGSTTYGQKVQVPDTASAANTDYALYVDESGVTNTFATVNSITAIAPAANAGNLLDLQSCSGGSCATVADVLKVSNAGATTIAPTANSTVALTVKGTTGTAAHVMDIYNSNATPTLQDYFDANGSLNVGQLIQPTSNNAVALGTASLNFSTVFARSFTFDGTAAGNVNFGASAASTNALNITGQTATAGTGGLVQIQGGNTVAAGTNGGVTIDAGSGATTPNGTVSIGNSNASTLNIGNGNIARTINIGNGGTSTTQTVNVGSTNGSSSLTLQGGTGTGAIALTTGSGGTIALNSTTTLAAGNYFGTPNGGFGPVQNLLGYSEQFDVVNNASTNFWTGGTAVTVTADSTTAPNGATTADTLAGTGNSNIQQTETNTLTAGTYTFSVWLKQISGAANTGLCIFANGGTGSPSTCSTTAVTPSSSAWQRFSVTQAISGSSITGIVAEIKPGNGSTASVYGWGAQLVKDSVPDVYVHTVFNPMTAADYGASTGNLFASGAYLTGDLNVVTPGSTTAFVVSDPTNNRAFQVDNANGFVDSYLNLYVAPGSSTAALQVVNNSSNAVLTVDTSANSGQGQVVLGKASSNNANLTFASSGGTNTISLLAPTANPTNTYTMTLPSNGASGAQCLQSTSGSTVTATVLTFAACGGGSSLAKNATDTSSAAVTSNNNLYVFTNSSSAVASGVLKLDNGTNTNSALTVTASGNPTAGQALVFVSDTNASPSGNLLDLQAGSTPTSKFSVNASGNVTGGTYNAITIGSTIQPASAGTLAIQSNGTNTMSVDTGSGSSLNLGNANASTINLGNANASTINIGNGNIARTINIGNGGTSTTQSVNIGSTNGSSATVLQGGAGNVTINTGGASGNTGSIFIQSGDSSAGTSGNITIDTGASVVSNGASLENDTFESGVNGWSSSFDISSVTQSTAQAHGGTHSLAAVSTGVGTWGIGASFPGPAVTPGQPYTFTAWVRGTSAQSIKLEVLWTTTGITKVLDTETDSTTGWTMLSGMAVAPVGEAHGEILINGNDGSSVATTYVDDATMSGSTTSPAVLLGATNAAGILIGNSTEVGTTSIFGGAGGIAVSATTGGTISIGNSNSNIINIGNTSSSNGLTLATGSGNISLTTNSSSSGIITKSQTNSSTAFQIQNAASTPILNVDDTNVNLVANPGFEVNATNWSATGTGTSVAQTTTAANVYYGAGALAATLASSGSTSVQTSTFASTPGASFYSLSFEAKGSAAVTLTGASLGTGTCTLSSTSVTTSWAYYWCTSTASITPTQVQISTSTTGQTLYIDNVQLETVSGSSSKPTPFLPTNTNLQGSLVINGNQTQAASSRWALTVNTPTDTQTSAGGGLLIQGPGNNFAQNDLAVTNGLNTVLSANATTNEVTVTGGSSFWNVPALGVVTGDAGAPAIIVKGTVSQTANILEVRDNSNNALLTVGPTTATIGATGSTTLASTIDIADTSNATGTQAVSIGSSAKAANSLTLEAGNTGTIAIGNAATAHTINIGTGAAVQSITLGSTNTTSATNIQGGTGNVNLKANNSNVASPIVSIQQAGGGDASLEYRDTSTSWYEGVDASVSHDFTINSKAAATYTGGTTLGEDFSVLSPDVTDSNAGWRQATKFTASASGTLSSITVAFDSYDVGSGSDTFSLGIYADNGSGTAPAALLGKHTGTSNVVINNSGGINWNSQTLDSPVSITSGTTYWLAMEENNATVFKANSTTSSTAYRATVTTGTWASTWTTDGTSGGANTTGEIGIYGTIVGSGSLTDTFSNPEFSLTQNGAATFRSIASSTTAFQVQNSAGTGLFTIDSSNNRIIIGAGSTGESTARLLVLDNLTGSSSDPTGVNGAMYYNATTNKFRCYENGVWKDCVGYSADNQRHQPYYIDDMYRNAASSEWTLNGYGSCSGGVASVTGTANHPGVNEFEACKGGGTSTANGGLSWLTGTANQLIAGGEVFEMSFNPDTLTSTFSTFGFIDSKTTNASPTNGVYFDLTGSTLTGKTSAGGTRSTTGTSLTLSTGTWYRAKIVINSNATQADYYVYNDSGTQLFHNSLTTNIPKTAGQETGNGVNCSYTPATTVQVNIMQIDYVANWYDGRSLTR